MTDAQTSTGPAKPTPALYDIGAFLSGGLNTTPEELRESLARLRSRWDIEYDQGDIVPQEADHLLDLLAIADRMVEMWEDDRHVLVVKSPFSGWSIEHSLRCRAGGDMAGCLYHQFATNLDEHGRMPVGRTTMLGKGGSLIEFETEAPGA